jgi:hypothetical protein
MSKFREAMLVFVIFLSNLFSISLFQRLSFD